MNRERRLPTISLVIVMKNGKGSEDIINYQQGDKVIMRVIADYPAL